MAEAAETLLKILEGVMTSHSQIVDSLLRLEERQHEHNSVATLPDRAPPPGSIVYCGAFPR
jgi:hypothetical protein